MENINLIRKIVWSFHCSTPGEEWDDLFQEAALAYCKALKSYNSKRGKISGYMWSCITSHLKDYLRKQEKQTDHICSIEDNPINIPINYNSFFESLSKEAQQIAEVVFNDPYKYLSVTPKLARKEIARQMMEEKHWSRQKIWIGIRDLKLAFS